MSDFGPVEIIALVLIVFSFVKLEMVVNRPEALLRVARGICAKPAVTSAVSLAFAAIVLVTLVGSGMTTVQILVAFVFWMCGMAAGVARYRGNLLSWP